MRIVYVSTRSDVIGGSNVHIRDMALAMQERGHSVLVLGGQEGPFSDDIVAHGLRYEPLRHLHRAIRPLSDIRAVIEIGRTIERFRPDLVSLHTAKAGVVGRLALWRSDIPVIYTAHGWSFTAGIPRLEAAVYSGIERLMAPLATRIVNVCEYEQDLTLARRVGAPSRHVVVHNAMPDVPEDLRSNPAEDPPRLVMVARFAEQKDHATLLEALSACRDLDWTIDLVGGGPLEREVRATAEKLSLADRVAFLGARNDVAAVLAKAQVFVLATRWEGFPRSVLEAMRAGLPAVASEVGGMRESIADGVNGFIVPPGDPEALADRLRQLIADPEARRRMGVAGRERYERQFRFETMFERTFAVYQEALEGRQ